MKRFYPFTWWPLVLGALLLLTLARPGHALGQGVALYTFSTDTTTYTPLVGATVVAVDGGGGSTDDGNSVPLPLGFSFAFGGGTHTQVVLNTNGWLTFAPTASTAVINSVLNQTQDQLIAYFGRDLDHTPATLSYLTDGAAPRRVFKVQIADFAQYNAAGSVGNAQVWLYEGSGRIELRYGAFNAFFTTPVFTITQAGLRGNGRTDVRALTGTWAAPIVTTSALAELPLDFGNVPVDGSVFRFEPTGIDITAPTLGVVTLTPPGGDCLPTAHTVTVRATDTAGVATVTLTYTVSGGPATTVPLVDVGGVWRGTIPAQGLAVVTWFVTATDASAQANAATSAPASYRDGGLSIDAGPDQTVNTGTPATLTASAPPHLALKITEFTLNSMGTGATTTAPGYLGGADDLVEITNTGATAASLSRYRFEVRSGGLNVARTYTLPSGVELAPGAALLLHLGPGTNDVVSNFYHTGGSNDPLGSGEAVGFLLLASDGTPVDGVAVNGFAGETGLPAGVWTGPGVNSPGGVAGAGLTGADTDGATGWAAATPAAPQTIGSRTPGLAAQPLPVVTWSGGTLTAPVTGNPLTTAVLPAPGAFTYTATTTQGTCTATDQVVVTVVAPVKPVANFAASTITATNNMVVTFTDYSANLPTTWRWRFAPAAVQFENGTSSTSRNPQVRFLRGGCYTVALTVANAAGLDSLVRTEYVCIRLVYCSLYLQGLPCGQFNGQINSVSIANTTLSNLNTGCADQDGNAYSRFPAVGNTTATLTAGQTYTLTVESSSLGSVGAWLDHNANGIFENSEFFLVTAMAAPPAPATSAVTFTVPISATPGLVGLRLRNSTSPNSISLTDACVTRFTGETEEYAVTVVAACTLPAPFLVSNGPLCVGDSLALRPAATQPPGTTYAWTGPNGFTSTAATPTLPAVTPAAAGLYSLVITATGCTAPASTINVVVTPLPTAPTGFTRSRCGAGSVTLIVSNVPPNTTYRWYTTATGGTPLANANANYVTPSLTATTTYYVAARTNGCESATRASVVARIDPPPAPLLTPAGPTTFCAGSSVVLTATGGAPGATYEFRRNNVVIPGALGVSYRATLTGSYTVLVTDPTTCAATSAAVVVTVTPAASAAFSYAAGTFCRTTPVSPRPTVTGTMGGTFSAAPGGLTLNATTGVLTLSTSAVGTYTVTYTVSGGCGAAQTQTVTVTTAPAAGFSYAAVSLPACAASADTLRPVFVVGASAGAFTATPTGLSLSTASGAIRLLTSAPGTYTVLNTIAASGGCPAATATATVTVLPPPTATILPSGPTTVCSDGTLTLTASGGTIYRWSTGATTPSISVVTSGVYTVAATNGAGCTATSAPLAVTVVPRATATFSYSATSYCLGQTAPAPATITGTTGGVFAATPAGATLDAVTGQLDLNTSVPGTYTITYAAGTACAASTAQTVTLTAPPRAAFSLATAQGCAGAADFLPLLPAAGATLGTLSVQPATGLVLDAPAGRIDLAASQPGTYLITNTVPGGAGCPAATATAPVTILAAPTVALTNLRTTYCTDDAAVLLTGTVDGAAGVGTALVNGQPVLALNPGLLGPGTHTVTYRGVNANGCATTVAQTVTVVATPPPPTVTAALQPSGIVVLTSSAASGNQWLLNGAPIAGATGVTYAVTANPQSGTYTVVTTVGGCASAPSATAPITVVGTRAEKVAYGRFQLYPNPSADGRLTLVLAPTAQAHWLTVSDAVGRVVYWQALPAATTTHAVDLATLPAGVYAVRVAGPAGVAVRRLIRE